MSGSGISWAICKSALHSRQITTSAPHHSVFTGRMPFLPPNQQRQSTEGTVTMKLIVRKQNTSSGCQRHSKIPHTLLPDHSVYVAFGRTPYNTSQCWRNVEFAITLPKCQFAFFRLTLHYNLRKVVVTLFSFTFCCLAIPSKNALQCFWWTF